MKIEEAILYCLASQNRRTSESKIKLACILPNEEEEDEVNRGTSESKIKLACILPSEEEEDEVNRGGERQSQMFVKAEGRIMLMI